MNRRRVLGLGGEISAAWMLAQSSAMAQKSFPETIEKSIVIAESRVEGLEQFSHEWLKTEARRLASEPYQPAAQLSDPYFSHIDYDQYRDIRFRHDAAIWQTEKLPFTLQLFHTGYIYDAPVEIFIVEGGKAAPLLYDPNLFTFGPSVLTASSSAKCGFSGFRIHTQINRLDIHDEFLVFQGASYFRSKATGQDYGLSARGLAINTAQPPADEFPVFRSFWVEKPVAGANSMTVFAILDSVSVAGVYKFVISNRHTTIMDVDCVLYPRTTLPYPGIAPLTSMFYFAPNNPFRPDEVRQRVHDSNGLAIVNGRGESIWRPLGNGPRIQFSTFMDKDVKGFGLLQRERRADRYQDFDAHYELRPSVWVEPKGDWGEGSVDLVELSSSNEYFDNIVAYWRPREPLLAGNAYQYSYRLSWCYEAPIRQNAIAVRQTLVGASTQHPDMRLFYIDFSGTENFKFCDEYHEFCSEKLHNLELKTSAGTILNVAFRQNPISGGHRLGFEYLPQKGSVEADIRCALISDGKVVSEVWIYRWTA